MALKSTVFKASLQIADTDRGYYSDHSLMLARHPSETDERMMARLLAFACYASEGLSFGKGLSDVDEPDLIERDLTGAIELWVEVGQPDEKAILKACGRAAQVVVLAYGAAASIWWKSIAGKIERARNLTVLQLEAGQSAALATLAQRNMQLQCTIQDGLIWMSDENRTVECAFSELQGASVQARSIVAARRLTF